MADGPTGARRPIWLSWSSGKDSAYTLMKLRQSHEFDVVGLLTTVNENAGRVAMHAVREQLLEQQAAAVGIPLIVVKLPYPCSNQDYEERMNEALLRAKADGIHGVAFGDIFLEEVRKYREDKMATTGIATLFPIWGICTRVLSQELVQLGFKATTTCIDPKKLDPSFVGRSYDQHFLEDLPLDVDPCGENGEFHTFVSEGPVFSRPVPCRLGEVVERDGFVFQDLLPA